MLAISNSKFLFLSVLLSASAQAGEAFNSSDVAISWPVKASNTLDTVYKMTGNGACNMPGLDFSVGNDKQSQVAAVSREHFNQFAEIVLGRGPGGGCNEIIPADMKGGSNAEVLNMNGNSHLSLMRGISGRACVYENWRIVGLRYDPCFNLNKLKDSIKDRTSFEKCAIELRLVAQPFNFQNGFFPEDQSVHLIYKIPARLEIIRGLAKIAKVTNSEMARRKIKWDAFDGKQDVFRAHPGLRSEMDNCLPGRIQNGPIITEIVSFLRANARDDLLTQIAWMTTSTTNVDWSFGFTSLIPDTVDPKITRVTKSKVSFIGPYDNFSQEAFDFEGIFPFNTNLVALARLSAMPLFGPKSLLKDSFTDAEKKEVVTMLDGNFKLTNPFTINQGESTCFSCHLNDQAANEIRSRSGIVLTDSIERYPLRERWPFYGPNNRSLINFRNFGIGPKFQPGVSIRTLNEIDSARKLLNTHYSDVIDAGLK